MRSILAYVVDLKPGLPVTASADRGSRSGGRDLPVMRYLSPRKIPGMSLHRSGQALVRFVEHRAGRDRGPVEDVYLSKYDSPDVETRYQEAIQAWKLRALGVGWAPAGWEPAETGHVGVLTVGELVAGYERYLDSAWGKDWRHVDLDSGQVQEYREALKRGWEQMNRGRRVKRG